MLNKIIRIALTAIILAWAVYQFIEGNIGNGIMFVFISALVLFTYFRNERILIALLYLRKQKLDKAGKIMDGIKNPEKSLVKGNLAYYYLLQGMILSQTSIGKAETMVKRSLNTGLRMKQDQAMAKLQLAGIAIARRRKREAMILLSEVKRLDTRGMLKEQANFMRKQMKKI